jgi:hypothetical protein
MVNKLNRLTITRYVAFMVGMVNACSILFINSEGKKIYV